MNADDDVNILFSLCVFDFCSSTNLTFMKCFSFLFNTFLHFRTLCINSTLFFLSLSQEIN